MKNFFAIFIISLCILTMIAGKIHWNYKINAVSGNSGEQQTTPKKEKQKQSETDKLQALTKHLPKPLKEKIITAKTEKAPLKMLALGSNSTPEGSGTWTSILQKRLDKAYGKGVFEIIVENYGDELSVNIVQQEAYQSALEHHPDIVLFEPFLINDNGKVAISNTLDSIEIIINKFQEKNKNVTIILQPPNPIHQAVYYPNQVKALEEFAEKHNYIYLHHWDNWPDYNSDEFLDYVNDDSLPNTNGHQVWADYLAKYFTGEKLK